MGILLQLPQKPLICSSLHFPALREQGWPVIICSNNVGGGKDSEMDLPTEKMEPRKEDLRIMTFRKVIGEKKPRAPKKIKGKLYQVETKPN